jgi:hypothetical protein
VCVCDLYQIDQLRRVGGSDVKEVTDNVMSKLLTNHAACYFNLDGRRGLNSNVDKKSFAKLPLFGVVQGDSLNK